MNCSKLWIDFQRLKSASRGNGRTSIATKSFIDTNVFVYAVDAADQKKHLTARRLIRALATSNLGVVSTQVLQEFFSVATRKLGHSPSDAKIVMMKMAKHELVTVELSHIEEAADLTDKYSISFWDALLVAAASAANCRAIITEDLKDGQRIGGLVIVNPF